MPAVVVQLFPLADVAIMVLGEDDELFSFRQHKKEGTTSSDFMAFFLSLLCMILKDGRQILHIGALTEVSHCVHSFRSSP